MFVCVCVCVCVCLRMCRMCVCLQPHRAEHTSSKSPPMVTCVNSINPHRAELCFFMFFFYVRKSLVPALSLQAHTKITITVTILSTVTRFPLFAVQGPLGVPAAPRLRGDGSARPVPGGDGQTPLHPRHLGPADPRLPCPAPDRPGPRPLAGC